MLARTLIIGGYVVGALITFRRVYLSELEDYYKDRLERARCTKCNGSRELCLKHHLADDDSFGPVIWGVFAGIIWPLIATVGSLYVVGKGIGRGIRKILFPRGINTPSKQKYTEHQESKKLKEEAAKLRTEIQRLGLDPDTLLPDPDMAVVIDPDQIQKPHNVEQHGRTLYNSRALPESPGQLDLRALETDVRRMVKLASPTPRPYYFMWETTSVEMRRIMGEI